MATATLQKPGAGLTPATRMLPCGLSPPHPYLSRELVLLLF